MYKSISRAAVIIALFTSRASGNLRAEANTQRDSWRQEVEH